MKRRIMIATLISLSVVNGCTAHLKGSRAMDSLISAEEVTQFLHNFEALAEKEDFNREAIQAVFEKTWRGDPSVKKARFYLSDIIVLTTDQRTATATYTYNWEGSQGEKQFRIQGRGTRVLTRESGQWQIIHEHLSRVPKL
jgi:ketosteroid isomerase-like protein